MEMFAFFGFVREFRGVMVVVVVMWCGVIEVVLMEVEQ